MTTTVTQRSDIETLSGPELVTVYNGITGEHIKRFSDRKAGVRRTIAAFEKSTTAVQGERPSERAMSAPTKAKAKAKTEVGQARRKRLDLPRKPNIRPHRPGTNRARLIEMLDPHKGGGATVDACMVQTGWDFKNCYEGIRILHTYLGYGLKEDENGVVRLIK